MRTDLETRPESVPEQLTPVADRPPLGGPILVASDGLFGAEGAVHTAAWLARAHGAAVRVVAVLEPVSPAYALASGIAAAAPPEVSWAEEADRQLGCIREQLARTAGDVQWPLEVRVGEPAPTIAALADALGAALIVMGIGRHRPIDRILRGETALRVMRTAAVPVLAVRQDARPPLVRALAAVDFSRASVRAARAVVPLLASPAQLWLAHVQPPAEPRSEAREGASAIHAQGVINSFRSLCQTLDAPRGLAVHPVVLEGDDPARELAGFGDEHEADVIVAGTHDHSLLERMLARSVTAKLVRAAPRAVLAIPSVKQRPRA